MENRNSKEIETAIATWGMSEVAEFTPPAEVVDAVLEDPEIALDYPKVYEKAKELKRQMEPQINADLRGLKKGGE